MAGGEPLPWLTLTLGSALFLGLYEVSRKAAVHDNAVLVVLWQATLGGLLTMAVLLTVGSSLPASIAESLQLQQLSARQHVFVAGKSFLVTSSWTCAFFAVKHLPISVASPLRATSPLFTALGAVLLFQERPSASQWLGVLLIFIGYWGLSVVGRREGIRFEANRWIALLVAGTLLGASSGLYDKFLLQEARLPPTTLQFWFTLDNALLQAALVAFVWWPRREVQKIRWTWLSPVVGVLLVAADQFYFRALAQSEALVSVIAMARRSSVLVSFALGGLLFNEQLMRQKSVVLAVILAGVVCLVL